MSGQWIEGNYVDDSLLNGSQQALAKAYPPGSLQMIPQPDGSYRAVNPRTGQPEVVYSDNNTSQMYFASDGQLPTDETGQQPQPMGAPTYHSDTGFNTLDEFLSRAIPLSLLAEGAAGVGGLFGGAAPAAAGGTATTAGGVAPIQLADAGLTMTDVSPGISSTTGGASTADMMATADAEQAAQGAAMQAADPAVGSQAAGTGLWSTNTFGPVAAGGAAGAATGATVSGSGVGVGTAAGIGASAAGAAAAGAGTDQTTGAAVAPGEPGNPTIGGGDGTTIDPNTGAVVVPGETGGFKVDPNTGDVISTGTGNGSTPTTDSGLWSRILNGAATADDWAKVLGTLGSTGLGIYGANKQADAMQHMYDQFLGLGAPSRARYEDSFNPNFDVSQIPGLQSSIDTTSQSLLRGLSTQGNPYGNPGGLVEANKYIIGNLALPTLQNYRNQNAATGGYGAFNAAAPSAGAGAINASGNVLNAAGYGLGQLTNPTPTLDSFFKTLGHP